MAFEFNVNTDAAVGLTNKLEKLNRSAFPNAVRGTLNGMALDVKKNTMPLMAAHIFDQRKKNFFKGNSRVNFAKGFRLEAMKSEVGFLYMRKGGNNKSIDELEQQEHGGIIKDRELIPLNRARTSRSNSKMVSKKNRLKGKKIVKASGQPGRNQKHKFFNAVIRAGIGGYVQTDKVLFRVKNIQKKNFKKYRWKFKLENIYLVNNKKSVKIKGVDFMKKASEISAKKGNEIYFKEGERQFAKYWK
jgi:hypothetical protein